MNLALMNPDRINVMGENNAIYFGGSQEWFGERWRRQSGCGAVAASNIIWYMRWHMRGGRNGKDYYIELMKEMFGFVKPGILGVNSPTIFVNGIKRYGARREMQITAHVLEIPAWKRRRPDICAVMGFIASALQTDAPVAFLNLSNGSIKNLGSWHWVTIVAIDTDAMRAKISDYGNQSDIDISEWLKTSALGGAFIYLQID